ncbi:hypothetical protein HN011_004844, partial [Eciton burchellii]
YSIRCYQCNSTSNEYPFQCNEFLMGDVDLQPESCDYVYGAQYCVKHVGRFEAVTLDCYQCSSEDEWKCMDGELVKSSLMPTNCDHIYNAYYCIKSIGRYGGGIGTKRFCSPVHMGNYCDYVKQPGDKLTYPRNEPLNPELLSPSEAGEKPVICGDLYSAPSLVYDLLMRRKTKLKSKQENYTEFLNTNKSIAYIPSHQGISEISNRCS